MVNVFILETTAGYFFTSMLLKKHRTTVRCSQKNRLKIIHADRANIVFQLIEKHRKFLCGELGVVVPDGVILFFFIRRRRCKNGWKHRPRGRDWFCNFDRKNGQGSRVSGTRGNLTAIEFRRQRQNWMENRGVELHIASRLRETDNNYGRTRGFCIATKNCNEQIKFFYYVNNYQKFNDILIIVNICFIIVIKCISKMFNNHIFNNLLFICILLL